VTIRIKPHSVMAKGRSSGEDYIFLVPVRNANQLLIVGGAISLA